jgi:hypothetical protein
MRLWLLGLLLWPALAGADDGVLLRMKFRAGEVRRYELVLRNEVDGVVVPGTPQFTTTQRIEQRVLSVDPQGTARVEVTVTDRSVEPSPASPVGPAPAVTCRGTVTARGVFAAEAGCGSRSAFAQAMGKFVGGLDLALPEKPVRLGASWRVPLSQDLPVPVPLPSARFALRGDALLTVRERKAVEGRDCLVIAVQGALAVDLTSEKGGADARATLSGDVCFDPTLGDYARMQVDTNLKIVLLGFSAQPQEVRMRMRIRQARLADTPEEKK